MRVSYLTSTQPSPWYSLETKTLIISALSDTVNAFICVGVRILKRKVNGGIIFIAVGYT